MTLLLVILGCCVVLGLVASLDQLGQIGKKRPPVPRQVNRAEDDIPIAMMLMSDGLSSSNTDQHDHHHHDVGSDSSHHHDAGSSDFGGHDGSGGDFGGDSGGGDAGGGDGGGGDGGGGGD